MRRFAVVGCIGAVVVAIVQPLSAQRALGDLRGQVRDGAGGPVEGVVVTLRGTTLMAPLADETGPGGRYRFVALPPGEYELVFEQPGGATRRYPRVLVGPGELGEVDAILNGPEPADAASLPRIESSALSHSSYGRQWIELAPIRRSSMFDLLNSAPGISATTSADDRAQSFGSSTNENRYLVDGQDVTSPRTGLSGVRPNPDAIEAIQVLSLGPGVEYGAVPGAVFNVVTRQGGPAWRGGVNLYLQPASTTGRNTTAAQDGDRPFDRGSFRDVTAQMGGPMVKDRVWLFGAFQAQDDEYTLTGSDPAYPLQSTAQNVLLKANGRFGTRGRFQLQYLDDFVREPEPGGANVDASARAERHGHTPTPSGAYWTTLAGWLIDARAGGFYARDNNDPEDGSARAARRFTEFTTGRVSGGIAQWFEGTTSRTTFAGRATKPLDGFLGLGHDLSLGVQVARSSTDYLVGNNDDIATASGRPVFGYTQAPHHRGAAAREVGFYIDDMWRMGRHITVNAGVRYDRNAAAFDAFPLLDRRGNETGSSGAISPLFSWNVVSPRAGVVLTLDGSGKSVVRATVGRYYRGIATGEVEAATPSIAPRYWFNGTYDRNDTPNDLDLIESVSRQRIDQNLRNPYIDQFGVAFEQQLAGASRVSASFVKKRGRDHTAWRDIGGLYRTVTREFEGRLYQLSQLAGSPDARVFQLTNPDGMQTEYRGVTIALENRAARRLFLRAALTLSESTGQLASSWARVSPADAQSSLASSLDGTAFGQNPNDFINADGVLSGDRPIVFKAQAFVNGPWRTSLALNAQHQSGRPWGRTVRVIGLGVSTQLLLEPLTDERRLGNVTLVDIRALKTLSVGASLSLDLFADVLNLFNRATGEDIEERQPGRVGFAVPTNVVWPRRAIVGAKVRF